MDKYYTLQALLAKLTEAAKKAAIIRDAMVQYNLYSKARRVIGVCHFTEDERVCPTLGVDAYGVLTCNYEWIKKRYENEPWPMVGYYLCHEVVHLDLEHVPLFAGCDPSISNIAADLSDNRLLDNLSEHTILPIPGIWDFDRLIMRPNDGLHLSDEPWKSMMPNNLSAIEMYPIIEAVYQQPPIPIPPGGGDPKGGDPKGGDPKGGDPKGGDPKGGDPKGGDPKGGDPKGGDPKGGEPKGGEPKGGDPKGGKPTIRDIIDRMMKDTGRFNTDTDPEKAEDAAKMVRKMLRDAEEAAKRDLDRNKQRAAQRREDAAIEKAIQNGLSDEDKKKLAEAIRKIQEDLTKQKAAIESNACDRKTKERSKAVEEAKAQNAIRQAKAEAVEKNASSNAKKELDSDRARSKEIIDRLPTSEKLQKALDDLKESIIDKKELAAREAANTVFTPEESEEGKRGVDKYVRIDADETWEEILVPLRQTGLSKETSYFHKRGGTHCLSQTLGLPLRGKVDGHVFGGEVLFVIDASGSTRGYWIHGMAKALDMLATYSNGRISARCIFFSDALTPNMEYVLYNGNGLHIEEVNRESAIFPGFEVPDKNIIDVSSVIGEGAVNAADFLRSTFPWGGGTRLMPIVDALKATNGDELPNRFKVVVIITDGELWNDEIGWAMSNAVTDDLGPHVNWLILDLYPSKAFPFYGEHKFIVPVN